MTLFTPRLLITDDDRDFRETVAGLLNERGFETLQAGDGEEALSIVCRENVHLLLLDMQMPRLSGLDTIEIIRGYPGPWQETATGSFLSNGASQPTTPIPWILISGCLDDKILARARAASAFSVLPKPIRLPQLTGAVASALQQTYGWHAA